MCIISTNGKESVGSKIKIRKEYLIHLNNCSETDERNFQRTWLFVHKVQIFSWELVSWRLLPKEKNVKYMQAYVLNISATKKLFF